MTPPLGCCSDDRKKLQSPPLVEMAGSSVWGPLSHKQIIFKFILIYSEQCIRWGGALAQLNPPDVATSLSL